VSGRSNLKTEGDTNLYCQNLVSGNRSYRVKGNQPAEGRIGLNLATELLVSWKGVISIPDGIKL
jgi:hypothetical protein